MTDDFLAEDFPSGAQSGSFGKVIVTYQKGASYLVLDSDIGL